MLLQKEGEGERRQIHQVSKVFSKNLHHQERRGKHLDREASTEGADTERDGVKTQS